MSSNNFHDGDELLRKYLLGRCSEDETEFVDRKILEDDDFADQVEVVEDELTEDYVQGNLASSELVAFEQSFLTNERRAQKIKLTAVLLEKVHLAEDRKASRFAGLPVSFGISTWDRLGDAPRSTQSPAKNVSENSSKEPVMVEPAMVLYEFDPTYFERLRSGNVTTQGHFISYFSKLLKIKLRARYLPENRVEDIIQETLARVFSAVRFGGVTFTPKRLGEYVNSVCNSVLQETFRAAPQLAEENDRVLNLGAIPSLESLQVTNDLRERISTILTELPEREREAIRLVFFESWDKDRVCSHLGVSKDYLRVLLHRALEELRSRFENK